MVVGPMKFLRNAHYEGGGKKEVNFGRFRQEWTGIRREHFRESDWGVLRSARKHHSFT